MAHAAPNSSIIYPDVPPGEEDPFVRINVMIGIFNAGLPSVRNPSAVNKGLYGEIAAALELTRPYMKITHGQQISRPLTAKEKAAGLKGDSQMVRVPMVGKDVRELDMVYKDKDAGGIINIVEVKCTKTVNHEQLEPNVALAKNMQGKVVYALGRNSRSQGKAIQEAFKLIPEAEGLPPVGIIYLPKDNFGTGYYKGDILNVPPVPTEQDVMMNIQRKEGKVFDDATMDRLEAMFDPAFG